MAHKYCVGIGLNLFDARAILLRDDGKVITEVEKKRKNVNANETINVLLTLFAVVVVQPSPPAERKRSKLEIPFALAALPHRPTEQQAA